MTTTVATLEPPVHGRIWGHARAGLLAIWAGVTGAAPHVLLALTAFAAIFTFSTLAIGPVLSSSDTPTDTAVPADDVDHHGHDDPTETP